MKAVGAKYVQNSWGRVAVWPEVDRVAVQVVVDKDVAQEGLGKQAVTEIGAVKDIVERQTGYN